MVFRCFLVCSYYLNDLDLYLFMFDELKIAARFVIQSSCGLSQETHAAVVRQMPVRSGPWQGTRPMQCTWRSTSATVEDVEGGSWEGLEPAKWLVSLSDWIVLKMFLLTLMVSPQPPPGWCHRSSHLCRCQSWWWWRTHPPWKMPLEVPSQQIAGWVLQAGKSFRVGKDL